MAGSKISGQVESLMDTGFNKPANGFDAKAAEPKSAAAVHNRGLTVGGKPKSASTGHAMSAGQNAAVHAGSPKGPHPAVAKNQGGSPAIKWG